MFGSDVGAASFPVRIQKELDLGTAKATNKSYVKIAGPMYRFSKNKTLAHYHFEHQTK